MSNLNDNTSKGTSHNRATAPNALGPRDQTLKEINQEAKENHGWLNSGTEKPAEFETKQFADANRNLGWGEQNPTGEILFKLNVDTKIDRWLKEFPDIKVHAFKMWKPARGGATHRCEYDGPAPGPATVSDRAKGLLAVLSNYTDLDDFSFNISGKAIAGYTYSAYGKKWVRLVAAVTNNSIELTFG